MSNNRFNDIVNTVPCSRTRRGLTSLHEMFNKQGGTWITASGGSVPTAGTSGYAAGCRFILPNAVFGQTPAWVNLGTESSCLFVPDGPSLGYGFIAAGARAATNGSTTEEIVGPFANTDIAIAGHIASDDDDYIASVRVTDDDGAVLITGSADPLTAHGYMWGVLRNKCVPTWDIAYAGQAKSTAAETTAITVTGVAATDIALACYAVTDDTDAIEKTVCTANTITVSHSATSSTGHTINYVVLRPRGTFAPSHYVAFAGAGVATTADASGIATNDVTLTGALSTDLAFVVMHTQGGTIEVAAATMAADKMTVQFNGNPSTTSAFSYFVLREY